MWLFYFLSLCAWNLHFNTMPANKKYLLKTKLGRTSKILAAILGTLATCIIMHTPLSLLFDNRVALVITSYSFYILWPLLMCMVYWIKKPWISWAVLASISVVSFIVFYIGK